MGSIGGNACALCRPEHLLGFQALAKRDDGSKLQVVVYRGVPIRSQLNSTQGRSGISLKVCLVLCNSLQIKTIQTGGGKVAWLEECLPSMQRSLSSVPSMA